MTTPAPFIGCTVPTLPPHQMVAAAEHAIRINPANRPPKRSTFLSAARSFMPGVVADALADVFKDEVQYIAMLTTKYWGASGVDLSVTFMETTTPALASKIVSHMNAWGTRANVQFRLLDTTNWQEGDVRISRGQGGYWSYLGTDIKHIPRNQQTMNLEGFRLATSDSEYRRVVRHETCHSLGAPHEHMRAALVQLLDPAKTIAYFQRTQGWSPDEIRQQVLTPLDEASIMATPADQDSIMCYQIPGECTRNGQPIRGGADINESDYAFIGKLYPKAVTPPPPPPPPPPASGFRYLVASTAPVTFTPQQ